MNMKRNDKTNRVDDEAIVDSEARLIDDEASVVSGEKSIVLSLLNARDKTEQGRILLEEFTLVPEGQSNGFAVRADLMPQMEELAQTIRAVLLEEGFAPVGDALDLQIIISRALMTPTAGDILIPVAVREVEIRHSSTIESPLANANPITSNTTTAIDESLFDVS
jgi:hypothetical protein